MKIQRHFAVLLSMLSLCGLLVDLYEIMQLTEFILLIKVNFFGDGESFTVQVVFQKAETLDKTTVFYECHQILYIN